MALYPRLTGEQRFFPQEHPYYDPGEDAPKVKIDSCYACLHLVAGGYMTDAEVQDRLRLDNAEMTEFTALRLKTTASGGARRSAEQIRSALLLSETGELPLRAAATYADRLKQIIGV